MLLTPLLDTAYHKWVTDRDACAEKGNVATGAIPATRQDATEAPKRRTGFALLPPEERQRIAKSGGQASAKSDRAWRWTAQRAREMASLGGHAARDKRRANEQG